MLLLGLKLRSFCLRSKQVINWVISLAPKARSVVLSVSCQLLTVAPVADIVWGLSEEGPIRIEKLLWAVVAASSSGIFSCNDYYSQHNLYPSIGVWIWLQKKNEHFLCRGSNLCQISIYVEWKPVRSSWKMESQLLS